MKKTHFTLASLMLLASGAAMAKDAPPNFTVAVIKNAVGSSDIVGGKVTLALSKLTTTSAKASEFDISLGLCVAELKSYRLNKAEVACNKAVMAADSVVGRSRHGKLLKAFAHNNRGIVRYLNDNTFGAYDDFTSALLLSDNKIIENNLNLFKSSISYASHINYALAPSDSE